MKTTNQMLYYDQNKLFGKDQKIKTILRRLRKVALLLFIILLFLDYFYGGQDCPIGFVLVPAGYGAAFAFLITASVAISRKRRIVAADIIRITCWTIISSGIGIQSISGYFLYFYPNYDLLITLTVYTMIIGGLAIIGISLLLYETPPVFKREHCSNCGYNLKGLTSMHCPECGEEFEKNTMNEKNEYLGGE